MARTPLPRPPKAQRDGTVDSFETVRWFDAIWTMLSKAGSIGWSFLDFTDSSLGDIETRNHNLLQFTRPTVTEDYDIDVLDDTIFGDATAGKVTITLPTAVDAVGPHAIKKIDGTLNFVTVAAQVGETLDRDLTFDLEWQDESINVESDGSNWHII
jgi:hypothetical protein